MTLQDFCITAKSLLAAGRHGDFVKMVINGIYDDHQVVVDPVVDTVDEYESTDGARDLDSAFGISSQIRVSTQLTVYPVPKHEDTLTRDVHLKYRFVTSQVGLNPRNKRVSLISRCRAPSTSQSIRFRISALVNGAFTLWSESCYPPSIRTAGLQS